MKINNLIFVAMLAPFASYGYLRLFYFVIGMDPERGMADILSLVFSFAVISGIFHEVSMGRAPLGHFRIGKSKDEKSPDAE